MHPKHESGATTPTIEEAVRTFEEAPGDPKDEARLAQLLRAGAEQHAEVLRASKEHILNHPNVCR
jgi:hypothetical protein